MNERKRHSDAEGIVRSPEIMIRMSLHQPRSASVIKRENKVDREKRPEVSYKQMEHQGSVNLA